MADLGVAYITIAPSMGGAKREITNALAGVDASGAGRAIGKRLGGSIGSGLSTMKVALGTALGNALSAGIAYLGGFTGAAIEASDATDKFRNTLNFAGLSTKEIDALAESTKRYADQTVYDTADIQSITAQLASNGVKGYDRLAEAAGNLNAAAGGNKDTFRSIGLVLTQTNGVGKLTTENFRQMSEAVGGIGGPLKQALADAGAFEGGVGRFDEAMQKGEISAEEFNQAIMDLGFADAAVQAATCATTYEGASGVMESSIRNFIQGGLDKLKPAATRAMQGVATAFDGLAERMQPVFDRIGRLASTFVGAFFDTIDSGGSAIDGLRAAFEAVGGPINDVIQPVLDLADAVGGVLSDAFAAFRDAVDSGGSLLGGIAAAFGSLPGPVKLAIGAFAAFKGASLLQTVVGNVTTMVSGVTGGLSTLRTAFGEVGSAMSLLKGAGGLGGVKTVIGQLGGSLKNLFPSLGGVSGLIGAITSPAGIAVIAIGALVAAFVYLWSTSEEFRDFWKSLWEQFKAAMQPVVDGFVGVVQAIGGALSTLASVVAPVFQLIWSVIQGVMGAIVALVVPVWEGIVAAVGPIVTGLGNLIGGAFNFIGSVISTVVGGIAAVVGPVFSAIVSWVQPVVDILMAHLGPAFSAVGGFIGNVVSTIGAICGAVFSAIGGVLDWIAQTILPAVGPAFQAMGDAIGAVVDWIGQFVGPALEGIANVLGGIADAVGGFFDFIGGGIKAVGDFFSGAGDQAEEAGQKMTDSVGNASTAISESAPTASQDLAGVKGAFESTASAATAAGSEIGSSAWMSEDALAQLQANGAADLGSFADAASSAGGDFSAFASTVGSDAAAAAGDANAAWSGMGEAATSAFGQVQTASTGGMDQVKASVTAKVSEIVEAVRAGFGQLGTFTTDAFSGLGESVVAPLTSAASSATNAANQLRSNVSSALQGAASSARGALSGLAGSARSSMGGVASTVSSAMSRVSSSVSSATSGVSSRFNSMRSTVTSSVNSMASATQSASNSMASSLNRAFSSVASQARSAINQAVSAVSSGCAQITRAWANMRFSTPHIPLPHFSVSGRLDPNAKPPTAPRYSVSWYARGGLFTGPSVIGVGERGGEYVLPLKASTLRPLAEMLAANGAGGTNVGPVYIGDEILRDPDGSRAVELLARAIDRKVRAVG